MLGRLLESSSRRHNVATEIATSPVLVSLLAPTEEGKKELLFLSNANPAQLERLCAYL